MGYSPGGPKELDVTERLTLYHPAQNTSLLTSSVQAF